MRVQVLYFAVLRERLHREQEVVELPDGARIGTLFDHLARLHPQIAALRPHLQVARNRVMARAEEPLSDGDEVAFIPPVAGGSGGLLRDTPLELDEVIRAVSHDGAGGVVTFAGAVRRESRGRLVARLEYEAYRPMAEERLRVIIDELEQAHAARVSILHRLGVLAVGELAVVIAASAPHRTAAFAACRDAIERLKTEVPIWKREIGEDGAVWVGLGP